MAWVAERAITQRRRVEWHRRDRQFLIARGFTTRRAAMVAHDAQHRLAIVGEIGEGAEFARHLGRSRISDASHDRRNRAADGAAFVGIIGDAGRHQQAADVGVAEAERPVFIREPGDLLRWELRHQHGDFEHDRPQPHGMFVGFDVENLGLRIAERQQVQRGQIAGRIVEEHIFGAGVRRDDRACGRAGVPVVDRRMILQPRIGRSPGGIADLLPQIAGLQRLVQLAVGAADQVPVAVGIDGAQEVVGDAHRIVRVLARDSEIGFRIPIGRVGLEGDVLIALARELDDLLDHAIRHGGLARELDLFLQRRDSCPPRSNRRSGLRN